MMQELEAGTPGRWTHEESVKINFNQFSRLDHKVDAATYSPTFVCHGSEWYLGLHPGGSKDVDTKAKRATTERADEVRVGVYLFIAGASMNDKECRAKFWLEFPDLILHLPPAECVCKKNRWGWRRGWGWPKCASRREVLDYCIDDTFTVVIHIQVFVLRQQTWTSTQSIQKDALRLMQEASPDVAFLVGADGAQQRIEVNSSILTIRAPGIKEMVDIAGEGAEQSADNINNANDLGSECLLPTIALPDVNPKRFRSMLAFIYNDDTTIIGSTKLDLEELLVTANRFGCWQLKLLIEAKLIKDILNLDESIDLLIFADAHSCFMLKESALALLSRSPFVVGHEDFDKLAAAPNLLQEVHRSVVGESKDKGVKKDKYSKMSVVELYRELEREGIALNSDGNHSMLLEHLRRSKRKKLTAFWSGSEVN